MSIAQIDNFAGQTECTEPDDIPSKEILEDAIQVLKKPKETRTPEDILILMKCTETNKFFQNIIEQRGPHIHKELCEQLEYQFVKANHIVFELGSFGTAFYIILSGTVEVLIRDPESKDLLKGPMQKIAELSTGGSFGELAILDSALRPRTATIKAKENCQLLVLERKPYAKILGTEEKRNLEKTVEFFSANPIFKAWSSFALKSWGYIFRMKLSYPRHTVLYKEGDKAEDIFFIHSGQIVCTKIITLYERVKGEGSLVIDDDNQLVSVARASTRKAIEIAMLGPGEIFGEEESYHAFKLENEKKQMKEAHHSKKDMHKNANIWNEDIYRRETTMTVVSSSAEIWKIPAKIFFSKMEQNSIAKHQFKGLLGTKKKRRMERIAEIQRNSASYLNYIQKEPNGKKKIIFSFKRSNTIASEKQSIEDTKDLSDNILKMTNFSKGQIEQSMQHTLNSQNSLASLDTDKKKIHLQSRSASAKVLKKRANSILINSLEQTKRSILKDRGTLPEPSEYGVGSHTYLPNDSESQKQKSFDQTDRDSDLKKMKSIGLKTEPKSYAKATSQIKLRLQEKLLSNPSLSKNDHLYGNFLKQYNTYKPDKIVDDIKLDIEQDESGDMSKRLELAKAAKNLANKQIERLFTKKSAPALERISSQPLIKAAGIEPTELMKLFKVRCRLLPSEGTESPSRRPITSLGTETSPDTRKHSRFSGDIRNSYCPGSGEDTNREGERDFMTRSKFGMSIEKDSKSFEKLDKLVEGIATRSVSVPRLEPAMVTYIHNEVRKLKETTTKQEASHTRSKLFNYNLKQMSINNPHGNRLLRMLEASQRSNKSPEKFAKTLKKTPISNERKPLHDVIKSEFARDIEKWTIERWIGLQIKRCGTPEPKQ